MAKEKKKKGKRITAGGNIGRTPTQTIVLQPTRRGGLDVSAYMDSIRQAELIDWPRRAKLIDLYADVMLDGHLFSVLRKQKAAILSTVPARREPRRGDAGTYRFPVVQPFHRRPYQ